MFLPTRSIRAADDDSSLQLLLKGPRNSAARAINLAGSVIGFREVGGPDPGASQEKAFYASKGTIKEIPLLPGYTSTFPTALSDNELVVGYCSKPIKQPGNPGPLTLQAFVWNPTTGAMTGLPVPAGFERNLAHGISADGSRISGVCGGSDYSMIACIWEKGADGWECKALPGRGKSPLLLTSGACISRDGKFICGMDGNTAARWSRQADGSWTLKVLKDAYFISKAVNDSGAVAGYRRTDDNSGNHRAILWTDKDGMKELGVLPNTQTSQALAINNAGLVVGSSGEAGRAVGPKAFVYQNGKLAEVPIPQVVVSYAYAVNEKGQIAGYCGRLDDESVRAFVWTPKGKE
jgi:probable HAF family extracellular repeat protein